jgi:hypothetical protein
LAGGSVTFTVANSDWIVIGQLIVVGQSAVNGPSTYLVTAVPTSTSFTGTWQAAAGDVAGGTGIPSGARVSPAGVGSFPSLSVTGAGAAYSLTATAARVALGTTAPVLTLTAAGTYLLISQFKLDYNGATFAAIRLVTMKLRRTNNTAVDLATVLINTDVVTTLTQTFLKMAIPTVLYTTTNSNDIIEMWGAVGVVPTAGSLDANEASILALKIT